jgi:hypothetical protein
LVIYKADQLLAHGRWFSPGTLASSTTKIGRHDIAESGIKQKKSNQIYILSFNNVLIILSYKYFTEPESKDTSYIIKFTSNKYTLTFTWKGQFFFITSWNHLPFLCPFLRVVCVHHLFHMTRRHIFWKIVILHWTNLDYLQIIQAYHQNYQKGCTRLAAASDKVYQLLAHGRWFSLGTLASSTTKNGHHDIAEILLKVALNTINQSIYTLGSLLFVYKKAEYSERTTDLGQATGKLYHWRLRVECILFCNLQSQARTHAILAIGLYELLGNPTTLPLFCACPKSAPGFLIP